MKLMPRLAAKISAFGLIASLFVSAVPVTQAGFGIQATNGSAYQLDYQANPGDTIQDNVLVSNSSPDPATVKLYGADGVLSRQGTFTVTTLDVKQKGIGVWTTISPDTITIPGNTRQEVQFDITLPGQVTPGSYSGGIVISSVPNPSAGKGTSVNLVARSVLPVYVTVPGEVTSKFNWQNFGHSSDVKNSQFFDLKFTNDGNTTIIFQTKVEIYGQPDGIDQSLIDQSITQQQAAAISTKEEQQKLQDMATANTLTTNDITLFQGQNIDIPLTWDKKPLYGQYTAKATTTYWDLNINTGIKSNPKVMTKEVTFTIIPWWLIWIVSGVILLAIILLVVKLIYGHSQKVHSTKYVVAEGESITSIAAKQGVNWKKIVHLNKLHPPYELKKGQTLLMPISKKK